MLFPPSSLQEERSNRAEWRSIKPADFLFVRCHVCGSQDIEGSSCQVTYDWCFHCKTVGVGGELVAPPEIDGAEKTAKKNFPHITQASTVARISMK